MPLISVSVCADMLLCACWRIPFVYPILAVLREYVATVPLAPTIWFVGMVSLMSVRVVDSTALRISSCTRPM